MPPTNNASTQTDLGYTDIDCSVAECNEGRANKLQLSKVVDDLESELRERKSNLKIIQGSDAKTRFYTGLLTFAVFMALLKFIEPYITVARQRLSNSDNSFQGRRKCLSTGEELLAVLMRLRLGLLGEDVADRLTISNSRSHLFSRLGSMCCHFN